MVEKKKDNTQNWVWLVIGILISICGASINTGNTGFVILFFGSMLFGYNLTSIIKKR